MLMLLAEQREREESGEKRVKMQLGFLGFSVLPGQQVISYT